MLNMTMTGILLDEPDFLESKNDNEYARFRIGVPPLNTRPITNEVWVEVNIFDEEGLTVAETLSKGDWVEVSGFPSSKPIRRSNRPHSSMLRVRTETLRVVTAPLNTHTQATKDDHQAANSLMI
jgi:single-stranded DNA-binding protein